MLWTFTDYIRAFFPATRCAIFPIIRSSLEFTRYSEAKGTNPAQPSATKTKHSVQRILETTAPMLHVLKYFRTNRLSGLAQPSRHTGPFGKINSASSTKSRQPE